MKELENLKQYQEKINETQYLINLLDWEAHVSAPTKSLDYLINVKTKLELDVFKLHIDREYKKLLEDCLKNPDFSKEKEEEQKYIKKLYNNFLLHEKIPVTFYEEYTSLCSMSNKVWREAKESNNYDLFKPYLRDVIDMTKQYYRFMDPNKDLYDIMLDYHEIGLTSDIIDSLFNELKISLIPLIKKVKSKKIDVTYKQQFTDSTLLDSAKILLEYIGFDFKRGALGIYPHGFTTKIAYDDVRIAFRQTDDSTDFVSTIIHEGGHGLFEQRMNKELGQYENECIANLCALHESQSRFYENILGRNINFWYPIYDELSKKLNLNLTLYEFVEQLNTVKVGPIRVEADELTYCLHIIIRYEMERAIFKENVSVDELPNMWNQKMHDYLGVDIKNNIEGLMQDVHWSEGEFGYFPSYLLGTIYDGMFLENVEENLGPIDELLKDGNIRYITDYLSNQIYQYGGAYNSLEVIERVCQKQLSVKPIINYFYKKYDR